VSVTLRVGGVAELEWLPGWRERHGMPEPDSGATADVDVTVHVEESGDGQSYLAAVQAADDGRRRLTVTAAGSRGVRYALNAVHRAVVEDDWSRFEGHHAPGFTVRGWLEGYYGRPWTHEQRLRLVLDAADLSLSHVMIAPKDDPRQRRLWFEPLTPGVAAEVAEIAALARTEELELVCAVSPGLSVCYSSPDDLDAITARFDQLHDLGVRGGGLLLDDIPTELSQPADLAAYPGLAEAHRDLVTRWAERMWAKDPSWWLLVCPTVYHGRGDEEYLSRLCEGLDPRVQVMWTGREICSRTIEVADAERFHRTAGRRPLWWDNYPVNDLAMRARLHVGPLLGRDPGLGSASAGHLANTMEWAESSRIPLGTIADYLWDPVGYDAARSWRRSLERVVGDRAEAYSRFADNVRSSCLPDEESPHLARELGRAAALRRAGDARGSADVLRACADEIDRTVDTLLRPGGNSALIEEARPWLLSYREGAEDLRAAAEVTLGVYDTPPSGMTVLPPAAHSGPAARLGERLRLLGRTRPQVFGDILDMYLVDLVTDVEGAGLPQSPAS